MTQHNSGRCSASCNKGGATAYYDLAPLGVLAVSDADVVLAPAVREGEQAIALLVRHHLRRLRVVPPLLRSRRNLLHQRCAREQPMSICGHYMLVTPLHTNLPPTRSTTIPSMQAPATTSSTTHHEVQRKLSPSSCRPTNQKIHP
jgi:hypothetical protein